MDREPSSSRRPLKTNSKMKYLSCSLRLNNNNVADLHDLQRTVNHFLAEPSQLAWLELSFNKISHIDQVLCELHKLRVLYLHGNDIFILSEVDRLGVLPHLHTITLHENMIETNKAYRNRVISALPQLKTMDFSAVTRQERVMAKILHLSNQRSKDSTVTAGSPPSWCVETSFTQLFCGPHSLLETLIFCVSLYICGETSTVFNVLSTLIC